MTRDRSNQSAILPVLALFVFPLSALLGCGTVTVDPPPGPQLITGTVVDDSTNQPVGGATVALAQPDANGIARRRFARSSHHPSLRWLHTPNHHFLRPSLPEQHLVRQLCALRAVQRPRVRDVPLHRNQLHHPHSDPRRSHLRDRGKSLCSRQPRHPQLRPVHSNVRPRRPPRHPPLNHPQPLLRRLPIASLFVAQALPPLLSRQAHLPS